MSKDRRSDQEVQELAERVTGQVLRRMADALEDAIASGRGSRMNIGTSYECGPNGFWCTERYTCVDRHGCEGKFGCGTFRDTT